ncbi:MAG TPA: RNA polymerase sigma factor RpoD/SigA [Spirochaetota bacterium]|nr:RNA polymerase sigma factor RpoD/SigA [Spirochaetota bacterium]
MPVKEQTKSMLERYLADIAKKPMLSRKQEYQTAVRISALQQKIDRINNKLTHTACYNKKDKQELEQAHKKLNIYIRKMMEGNYRLVISVAKKYSNSFLQLLDLIEEGNLGLLSAIHKYDPDRGNRFSTFAIPWIKQGITKAIRETGRMIRIPVHIDRTVSTYKKVVSAYQQEANKQPPYQKIKKYFDISEGKMTYYLNVADRTVSLNVKSKDVDKELQECILDKDNKCSPSRNLMEKDLSRAILDVLNRLNEKEKKIIIMRYGLFGSHRFTLDIIGRLLHLTRERVRQIQMGALEKLKNLKDIKALRYFLN